MLRAKDPKVRCAQVCEMVAGLVLQGTQVMNADPWMHNKEVLHTCKQLAMIMKDIEESLDDAQDNFEGMQIKKLKLLWKLQHLGLNQVRLKAQL